MVKPVTGYDRLLTKIAAVCAILSFVIPEPYAEDAPMYAGRVVFEGQPVEGAEVYLGWYVGTEALYFVDPELVARTDADGRFSAPQPSADRDNWVLGILVKHPDYAISGVRLTYRDDSEDLAINLDRPVSIMGVVRSVDGEPLEDVRVNYTYYFENDSNKLFLIESDLDGMVDSTDAEGRYHFDKAPEGAIISLSVQKQGYVYGRARADAGKTAPDITLERPGSISGRVTFADTGEPVAGVQVTTSPAVVNGVVTDNNGIYVLDGIQAGTYQVRVISGEQHLGYYAHLTDPVDVNPNDITEHVDVQMEQGVVVSGTITDLETGEPISGCSVDASFDLSAFSYSIANTNAEGRFQITAMPGDSYFSAWSIEGYSSIDESSRLMRVMPIDGSMEGIHLQLVKKKSITGTVYLPDGTPAKGALVGSLPSAMVRTDKSGKFTYQMSSRRPSVTIQARLSEQNLEGETEVNTTSDAPVEIYLHRAGGQ